MHTTHARSRAARTPWWRLLPLLAALAMIAAACGDDGDTAADQPTPDAQEEAAGDDGAGEDEAAEGDAARELANVTAAWKNDPLALDLDPLEPPADDIVVNDTSQYAKDEPYRIAFASQGPTNSWALTYDESLFHHAEQNYPDLELLYADANGDADKQVNDIEDLLVQQPDALIVTPLGAAVQGSVERAAAQGVPVILCTGRVDTDAFVTRVDRDNRLNGTLTAEWIAKQIDYDGKIVMISGIAGVPTAEDRLAAASAVFEQYPDIEILGHEYANWSPTEGKRVMESLLVEHDEIDAVWSDSGFLSGAVEAFGEAGREIPPLTGEPVNGFLRVAAENDLKFAAVGYPPSHSTQCLDAAVETLQGEPQPSFINVDAAVFTQGELDQYYEPECSDDLWVPSELPERKLDELNLC
ncbi:MAG: substrate-binding domain-containing protein [Egibacteraceae bacterium]